MKLSTSLKNANAVADRIKALSGIIMTPEGSREAVRIKRAWLFGSTAKGKVNPNDTDIILEVIEVGSLKLTNKWRMYNFKNNAKTDKRKRMYGLSVPIYSYSIALRYLAKNLKMVRIHHIDIDGEYATDRVMIYPRNDLEKIVR